MQKHHVVRDEEGLWIVTEPEADTGVDWTNRVAPMAEHTTTDLAEAEAYIQRQTELEN
tara:strand:- start:701 stop:874 length:174 start_codon:yes stop_codon:yes gene_type:complete